MIKDSYADDAMFMNIFRITRFTASGSFVMRNLQLTETNQSLTTTIEILRNEIPDIVEKKFLIPADVVEEAFGTLKELRNTFD